MFDIGFSELLVIAVVALLVLGPERLPKAARFAGLWVRKARAQWYSVKSEFEREMASDELKRSVGNPLGDLRAAATEAARDLGDTQRDLAEALRDTEALVRADADAATAVQDIPAAAAPAEPAPGTVPVPAPETADAPPVQAELDNFEFYTDPAPEPPAGGPSDPSRP
jgi:sec-independent protein translocase protein TatB